MGYITDFYLSIGNTSIDDVGIITALEDICGYEFDYCENTYHTSGKWYSRNDDMLKLSQAYPIILFTLTGYGEESGDIWRAYYLNGKTEKFKAEIVFKETTLHNPPQAT